MTPLEHFRRAEELLAAACQPRDADAEVTWETPDGPVYLTPMEAAALASAHAQLAQIGTPLSWQGGPR